MMRIGIDSFTAAISDPATGLTLSPVERMQHLLQEIELTDQVGLDVFGIGEHPAPNSSNPPQQGFWPRPPRVPKISASQRRHRSHLSAADPVRVFQEFAALDLISRLAFAAIIVHVGCLEGFRVQGVRMR
jgi:hypothetical protein